MLPCNMRDRVGSLARESSRVVIIRACVETSAGALRGGRRREGVHPALAFMSTGMSHNNWRAGASSLRMRLDYIRACSRSSMRDLTSQRTLVHAAAFAAIFRSSNLRGSKVQVVSRSCRYSHCRMARADTVIGVLAPARQKCHAFTH